MAIMAITDASFEQEVLKSTELVVVDFWAEWCSSCRLMIAPALEQISEELSGKIKITKINVDEHHAVASQFGIRSVPALLLFKDGQLAGQRAGAAPKGELSKWIQSAL